MAELKNRLSRLLGATARKQTGHTLISRRCGAHGITHAYGVPGRPVYETYGAFVADGIQAISTRQQNSAGYASAAHNFLLGRVASVVCVSAGPGITQVATAALVASTNRWPLVVIAGSRRIPGTFQAFGSADALGGVCKWLRTAESAAALPALVDECIEAAVAFPPGPVCLEVPEEVLNATAPEPAAPVDAPVVAEDSDRALDDVLNAMRASRRPVVVLGDDLRWFDVGNAPARIAEAGVGIVTTSMADGLVSWRDDTQVTNARSQVFAEADLVLAVGAPLDWRMRFGVEIAQDAQIFAVHDLGPYASAVAHEARSVQNVGPFVQGLAAAAENRAAEVRADWRARLAQLKREAPYVPTHSTQAMCDIAAAVQAGVLREDVVVAHDGNVALLAGEAHLHPEQPFARLAPGDQGCIGVGVPFAMGAGGTGRRAVVLTGDVGFSLCVTELETMVRCGLAATIVVADNGGNMGPDLQQAYFGDHPVGVTTTHESLDWVQVARGLGAEAERVTDLQTLSEQVRTSLDSGGLNVLVVPAL